ncbi:MAG: hypothetical protein GY757_19330, partial [bacterium]|nr:hypothetical protein [bacterium]
MKNKFILFLLIAVFLLYSLTVASPEPKKSKKPKEPEVTSSPLVEIPAPPKEKVLIAIAGFENKSTYSADKLWDTSAQLLMSELLKLSYFRVVEWAKMKQLFDWKALSTSSLIKDPGEMAKA